MVRKRKDVEKLFFILSSKVRPCLEKESTVMREPVSVETQVVITLYYLLDEGRYRQIANAFGVGKSTVSKTVRSVCQVLSKEYHQKVYQAAMHARRAGIIGR